MSPSLHTQLHRAVFALPLAAIALAAAFGTGSLPAPPRSAPVAQVAVVQGAASTLPGDQLGLVVEPKLDCAAALMPAGPRGLARMPGDISALAGRLRCAQ